MDKQATFNNGRFSWQEGYSAFSYSKSHVMQVVKYIETQEEHHKKKTFIDEYKTILKKFDVEFDERYIFQPVEESRDAFLRNADGG